MIFMEHEMRVKQMVLALLVMVMLAACSSSSMRKLEEPAAARITETGLAETKAAAQPGSGGYLEGDGPGADVPANLDAIPDAAPKAEKLHPYANRPYTALGKTYTPMAAAGSYKERGVASWYGKKFHGQRTSSGEIYDMYAMTAAHTTLPIPSYVRVTNLANGKSVVVRVNDRGPFLHSRIIDLSYTAAHKLGIVGNGSGEVEVESLAVSDIASAPLAQTEPVRTALLANEPLKVEPLPPEPAKKAGALQNAAPGKGGVYLQLGAFKSQEGAESFLARMRSELDGGGEKIGLYQKEDGLIRVHMGPYASADEARSNADKLQKRLGFKPIVSQH